jgi:hypothetical protein
MSRHRAAFASKRMIPLVALLLLLGACGEDDLEFPGSGGTPTPVPTQTPSGTQTPTPTPTPTETPTNNSIF